MNFSRWIKMRCDCYFKPVKARECSICAGTHWVPVPITELTG